MVICVFSRNVSPRAELPGEVLAFQVRPSPHRRCGLLSSAALGENVHGARERLGAYPVGSDLSLETYHILPSWRGKRREARSCSRTS